MENHDLMLDIINNFSFIENGYYAQNPDGRFASGKSTLRKALLQRVEVEGALRSVRTEVEAHKWFYNRISQ